MNLSFTIRLQKKMGIVIMHLCVEVSIIWMNKKLMMHLEISNKQLKSTLYKVKNFTDNILGNLYTYIGEKEKALNDYNQAIQHDPKYVVAYFNGVEYFYNILKAIYISILVTDFNLQIQKKAVYSSYIIINQKYERFQIIQMQKSIDILEKFVQNNGKISEHIKNLKSKLFLSLLINLIILTKRKHIYNQCKREISVNYSTKFFYFTNKKLFSLLFAVANNPNNINFKKQINQEISQFIGKVFLINCLQHPNNYNMIEYIMGEQLIKLQQDQIKSIQTDVNELITYDYYQITDSHQNQSLLHSKQSQSDKESYNFEYIDQKIEEKLNEFREESAILDINLIKNNEVEFQSECGLDQFNTFVETNFLTDYKFIMKQHLDSKINSSSIRTSFQHQ